MYKLSVSGIASSACEMPTIKSTPSIILYYTRSSYVHKYKQSVIKCAHDRVVSGIYKPFVIGARTTYLARHSQICIVWF